MLAPIRKFKTCKKQTDDLVILQLKEDVKRICKDRPDGYLMIWKKGSILITKGNAGFNRIELLGAIESLKSDLVRDWGSSGGIQ